MPSRKSMPNKPWSMYPTLHDDVSYILEKDDLHLNFHRSDSGRTCIKEYDTNIMGQFVCRNHACSSNGWSSKRIAITIRMYPRAQYNARVYNQSCQRCNRLGEPHLDDSYAERVAYRLKKWCGIEGARPIYSGQSNGPHQVVIALSWWWDSLIDEATESSTSPHTMKNDFPTKASVSPSAYQISWILAYLISGILSSLPTLRIPPGIMSSQIRRRMVLRWMITTRIRPMTVIDLVFDYAFFNYDLTPIKYLAAWDDMTARIPI